MRGYRAVTWKSSSRTVCGVWKPTMLMFLAHRWDGSVAMEEYLSLCERWVTSGKVRCVGSSNWPCWRIAQACEIAHSTGLPRLQVTSPKYNLLRRGVELEQTPCARHI